MTQSQRNTLMEKKHSLMQENERHIHQWEMGEERKKLGNTKKPHR